MEKALIKTFAPVTDARTGFH